MFLRIGLKSLQTGPLFCVHVTEQAGGGFTINYYRMDSPLPISGGSPPHTHLLGSKCPPPEERRLSMPETGEKERNYLFKSYTDLRVMT